MTTELSLMKQMPIWVEEKNWIHTSTWIWMNGNIRIMGHKWLCNAYVDSCYVQFNKETYHKFLHMEKSDDPSRPPKTEWSIIILLLWFCCLPHIVSCVLKSLIKTHENSNIFELYEYPCILQSLYKEHRCSSGLLICVSSSFLLYNLYTKVSSAD